MISLFFLLPLIVGLFAFIIKNDQIRRTILVFTALSHTSFTIYSWFNMPDSFFNEWLKLDNIGLLFLSITSMVFLMVAFYCVGYLSKEKSNKITLEKNIFFTNAPEAVFTGFILLFLSTMSLVTISNNLGLLWVAVEASTLVSAPLIYFHKHNRSLEAIWKYLMICSVGIALALLGNFLLAVSLPSELDEFLALNLNQIIENGHSLKPIYLKTAFIFFLVGYGTKMGLAPMHTWLPDAHSEAPSAVSALLSGALLNCSFLGILRIFQICNSAEMGNFCKELFIIFGLLSMAISAIFILRQVDYKRMLAYSSIEHMGILVLGIGIGKSAIFGSVLHSVNHSFTKAMLFLLAGNILAVYKTKKVANVKGLLKTTPITGILWIAGFLSMTGFPPFGTFLSEFTILKGALEQKYFLVAIIYLFLLAMIFIGMAISVLGMSFGKSNIEEKSPVQVFENLKSSKTLFTIIPPAILGLIILIIGLYLPTILIEFLQTISKSLGAY